MSDKFQNGDVVVLDTAFPARGEGSLDLDKLNVGVIVGRDLSDGDYIINFPEHQPHFALESELRLATEDERNGLNPEEVKPKLQVGDMVRINTSRWEPEAKNGSDVVVVEDGSIEDYYCNDGKIELGFALRNLERGNVVKLADLYIVGATYRVTSNQENMHFFKDGDLVVCESRPGKHSRRGEFRCVESVDESNVGMKQYVNIIDVELVPAGTAPEVSEAEPEVVEEVRAPGEFKAGDKVRVVVTGYPHFGWGKVSNGDEGTVVDVYDTYVEVDFPAQTGWAAHFSELELVTEEASTAEVKAKVERAERAVAPVYVVVREDREDDFLLITEDREEARAFKTRKGGKRAGYIINQYVKAKEIR